jgi:hypothetical protein
MEVLPKVFHENGSFDFLTENEHVFIGFPKVHLVNKTIGLKEFFSSTIEVFNKEKKWEIFNPREVGRRRFRFKDRNANILGVRTLNILPPDFKITVNQRSKTLDFSSQTNFKIFLLRNGINTFLLMNNSNEIIKGEFVLKVKNEECDQIISITSSNNQEKSILPINFGQFTNIGRNININPHSQEFISLDVAQNFYTCKST